MTEFASLPDGPLILIANEFLDALPVRQFHRAEAAVAGALCAERRLCRHALPPMPPGLPPEVAETDGILEINEASEAFVAAVGRRVVAQGGAALILDYGSAENPGDSLQAIRAKRPAEPLLYAGEADLTALVDFGAVARAAVRVEAMVQGPLPQGTFLTRLGLFQRAERLARGRTAEEAATLMAGVRRLAEPLAMGRLFKAMAITTPSLPPLPGFAA